MIVVADASPLTFLAKARQLDLVPSLLGTDTRIPRAVHREVVTMHTEPVEQAVLESFFARCTVTTVRRPRSFAAAMSAADNAALTLAIRCKADVLLCDERVTRTMAETEGIRPLGTLGILLRAMQNGLVTGNQARKTVDLLVGTHHFRIGVELYCAVLREMDGAT